MSFIRFNNCYHFATFVFLFFFSMHVVVIISEPLETKLQISSPLASKYKSAYFLKTRTFNDQNQKS